MKNTDENFDRLMRELADGSESAAEEFLQAFGPLVFRIVRRRLGVRSPRFDSADIAQAVWASFFGREKNVARFASPNDLVRYLAVMATNRVRKSKRDLALQKRAVSREVSLENALAELPADSLTASQLAIADETWERLLAATPHSQQQILFLRLEGKSQEEIATVLGVSTRTVGRLIERLRRRVRS